MGRLSLSMLAKVISAQTHTRSHRSNIKHSIACYSSWILENRNLPGAGFNFAGERPLDELIKEFSQANHRYSLVSPALPMIALSMATKAQTNELSIIPDAALATIDSSVASHSTNSVVQPETINRLSNKSAITLTSTETLPLDFPTTTSGVLAYLDQPGTVTNQFSIYPQPATTTTFSYLFGDFKDSSNYIYNPPDGIGTYSTTISTDFNATTPTSQQAPGPTAPTFVFGYNDVITSANTSSMGVVQTAANLNHTLDSTYNFYDVVNSGSGGATRLNLVDHPYTLDSTLSITINPPTSDFEAGFSLTIKSDQFNFTASISGQFRFGGPFGDAVTQSGGFQKNSDGTYSFLATAHNPNATATNDHIQISTAMFLDGYNLGPGHGSQFGVNWGFTETTT